MQNLVKSVMAAEVPTKKEKIREHLRKRCQELQKAASESVANRENKVFHESIAANLLYIIFISMMAGQTEPDIREMLDTVHTKFNKQNFDVDTAFDTARRLFVSCERPDHVTGTDHEVAKEDV